MALFFDTLTLLKSYILGDPIFQFLISIPLKNILFTDKKWGCKQESIIGFDQRRYSRWCDHSPRARILECEVKWALGSTTMNKASGGIPVELFQILKDGAVKVLHLICQQIWKTEQWL